MDERRFHIEINSLEDFIQFVHIIRNDEIDPDKLKRITDSLTKSTKLLVDAEKKVK